MVDYYGERLALNSAALAYLKKRGLNDPELIRVFKIGFCDRTLGLRLPFKNRVEGAALRACLARLGLLRDTGHEHLRGRIVFPIPALPPGSPAEALAKAGPDDFTHIGTVYGRAIDDRGKHDRHLFLPGPQRGIWNPAALRSPELILTEGVIDALTFWSAGFKHVTTGYSAKALPGELLDAIVAAKVRLVFIAFDRDEAGDKGAEAVAAQLMARGLECRRVLFPHGHDANSYALAVTPPEKSLAVLLNAAAWLGKGQAVSAPVLRSVVAAASSSPVAPAPSSLAAKAAVVAAESAPVPPSTSNEAAREKADVPATTATSAPASAARHEMPQASPGAGTASLLPQGEHWLLTLDGREYRIGGLEKTLGTDALKVALRLKVGDRFHLDSLDLAKDGERRRFIERAAEETGLHADLLKRDVGRLLLAVETAQGELRRAKPRSQAKDVRS